MKVKLIETAGFAPAFKWMRYAKLTAGDSYLDGTSTFNLGKRDMRLAQALIKAPRDSHAKMCRVIWVWLDVTATLKWWKQYDTYKIATTALSTSTMNSLMDTGVTQADFTNLVDDRVIAVVEEKIAQGNEAEAFANLPLDYLQLRGLNLNYQTLRNIWLDRRNHKLPAWRTFLERVRALCPYAQELIFCERGK